MLIKFNTHTHRRQVGGIMEGIFIILIVCTIALIVTMYPILNKLIDIKYELKEILSSINRLPRR